MLLLMLLSDDVTSKWKRRIYKNYGTLFKTRADVNVYAQFIPYAKYIISNYFPKEKNVKIIDLGCGIGGFIKSISQAGYSNIEGIDISEESVSIAHNFGVHQVRHGDIFKYLENISDNSVDVVLCLDVLEHFVREEGVRLLLEVERILKSGGRILLHIPNAEGIFGAKIRYADFTHEMAFTQKSIAQLLQYVGFVTVRCYEDKPIAHNLVSTLRRILWTIFTLPYRILHAIETGSFNVKLSQNILVIAEKVSDVKIEEP